MNLRELFKKSNLIYFLIILILFYTFYFVNYKVCLNQSFDNKISQFQKNLTNRLVNSTSKIISKIENLPTIFCLIKTHPKNIAKNITQIIYRVWVKKCDNYRFVTLLPQHLRDNKSKPNDTIEVFDQLYMIQPFGLSSETHENLTSKMYYAIKYVYKHFKKYDWYHIVDDDAYVNINNYKQFLKDKSPKSLVTFGFNFKTIVKNGYHSGGPGYGLSNEAFRRIGNALTMNMSNCQDTGTDDVDINACLRTLGVSMGVSRDKKGRERFIPLGLMDHFNGWYPDWMYEFSFYPVKKGLDCCSDSLIAVHYVSPRDVFRLDLAIETQKNSLKLYDDFFRLGKHIEIKNIIKNYIFLEDIENNSNSYKDVINF